MAKTGRIIRINFEDQGQDILWWDVDEDGKVIACNAQDLVWYGTHVLFVPEPGFGLETICPGDQLLIRNKIADESVIFIHPVESVEQMTLTLTVGKKKAKVGSLIEASIAYCLWRGDKGSSNTKVGVITDAHRHFIGRISYNGRIWDHFSYDPKEQELIATDGVNGIVGHELAKNNTTASIPELLKRYEEITSCTAFTPKQEGVIPTDETDPRNQQTHVAQAQRRENRQTPWTGRFL